MKTIPNRVCIYPHDIALITGLTLRQCRNIHNDAKAFFKKTKIQPLTVDDFCSYMKIPKETVEPFIK
ncbi:hypothetical protein [Flavobacterium sp.]|uniref:hypothetical protein n=1 Tax=Flavobacterium sp. TaxID=239 RepID=UPI003750AB41